MKSSQSGGGGDIRQVLLGFGTGLALQTIDSMLFITLVSSKNSCCAIEGQMTCFSMQRGACVRAGSERWRSEGASPLSRLPVFWFPGPRLTLAVGCFLIGFYCPSP